MRQFRWLAVRLLILAAWSYITFDMTRAGRRIPVVAAILFFAYAALAVRYWAGRQYRKIPPDVTWQRPSWLANPFLHNQPMQFMHLLGFCFLLTAIVSLLNASASESSAANLPFGFFPLSFACGTLVGVRWFVQAHCDRFSTSDGAAT